jgi:hypothetical protein
VRAALAAEIQIAAIELDTIEATQLDAASTTLPMMVAQ